MDKSYRNHCLFYSDRSCFVGIPAPESESSRLHRRWRARSTDHDQGERREEKVQVNQESNYWVCLSKRDKYTDDQKSWLKLAGFDWTRMFISNWINVLDHGWIHLVGTTVACESCMNLLKPKLHRVVSIMAQESRMPSWPE